MFFEDFLAELLVDSLLGDVTTPDIGECSMYSLSENGEFSGSRYHSDYDGEIDDDDEDPRYY